MIVKPISGAALAAAALTLAVAGAATVTPASLLYLLVDSGDIEVPAANLVAN